MSFCSNCGAPVADGARFCASCGAPVQPAGSAPASSVPPTTPVPPATSVPPVPPAPPVYTAPEPEPAEEVESPDYDGMEVKLCSDGKYHWTYPLNMYKNPSIFLTVCKIFGILGGIMFILLNFSLFTNGDWETFFGNLKYWGIAVLVFLAIALLSYLIVAGMYHGKYIVRFTMDEERLLHDQIPAQKKNARIIGGALAGAGVLTKSPGRTGQGAMVAVHTSLESNFANVKRIKAYRGFGTIKVNAPFSKNQVYTTREDFDFVLDYIRKHCPKAK